ncbi:MAG: undecaprenyl-diphosphate phosphatase [Solirubrobacteraceae bacterium]
MLPAERRPSLSQAVVLGLLQGPAELLPISSSAHTTLIPWLAGSRYPQLGARGRKSLEVSLHAGAGLALALQMHRPLRHERAGLGTRGTASLALAILPPALAGLALRGPIERHLGGPRAIAAGLAAGALAMAWADRPGLRRRRDSAGLGPLDGLSLGVAQALALAPGVSRNGATLAAARARGFDEPSADALSWLVGLPVLLGASGLEAARILAQPPREGELPALAGGAVAAFCSTTLSARVLRSRGRARRLLPFSVYRCLLAALVLVRARRAQ